MLQIRAEIEIYLEIAVVRVGLSAPTSMLTSLVRTSIETVLLTHALLSDRIKIYSDIRTLNLQLKDSRAMMRWLSASLKIRIRKLIAKPKN